LIILLDLDGTLTDTAHLKFKPMKDGLEDTVLSQIPIFPGAIDFIKGQKEKGNIPIIVSDSHPKYVNKIASQIFEIDCVSLTDKPNIQKTISYLNSVQSLKEQFDNKDNFLLIGDSWLDIELGRRLNIRTVLTKFYKASAIEERDGIGQDWKPVKMGPTYYANDFIKLEKIIDNPQKELLALEAIFQGYNSDNMVKFIYRNYDGNFTAFRCLARQEDGECDKYARADKYYQIDNPNRSNDFLQNLASATSNYLKRVSQYPAYKWDYLTYVSDKHTTSPPNKMKEIFDLVDSTFSKLTLFKWSEAVEGSLRNQPNYQTRRDYIAKYLSISNDVNLSGKSIIVIDDQFTSSATANEISSQLRNRGAKNILFIALFYLILPIESKNCPKCDQLMKVKIKKTDGSKFYSCVPPKYRGNGCGHIENIN
jgi:phosphoglycolate phosphatase-like HAD superfamily hydrolase